MPEIPNDSDRKSSSVILKRGRTIRKRGEPVRIVPMRQRKFPSDSALDRSAGKNHLSCPVVQVGEQLLTGTEVEFCPIANEKRSEKESESVIKGSSNEGYKKLYIPASADRGNKRKSKNYLLKNIQSIESNGNDNSYGINVSNSRFFVPKNYLYLDRQRSMDDLRFEVDPQMGKLFHESMEKMSRVGLNYNGSLPNLIGQKNSLLNFCNSMSDSNDEVFLDSDNDDGETKIEANSVQTVEEDSSSLEYKSLSSDQSAMDFSGPNSMVEGNGKKLDETQLIAEPENSLSNEAIALIAKPILIGDPDTEDDFVIGKTLINPNPAHIIEPTIFVPRESSTSPNNSMLKNYSRPYTAERHKHLPKKDQPTANFTLPKEPPPRRCNSCPNSNEIHSKSRLSSSKLMQTSDESSRHGNHFVKIDSRSKRLDTSGGRVSELTNQKRIKLTENTAKISQRHEPDGINKSLVTIPFGRTFSLKEKFEPIAEDVELRRTKRPVGIPRGCKSALLCQMPHRKSMNF